MAKLASNGHFSLRTGDQNGAVAGKHRIVIVQMIVGDDLAKHDPKAHSKPKIVHAKHSKFATSSLEREVNADEKNDYAIEVDAAE